jgi:hypothetical protein
MAFENLEWQLIAKDEASDKFKKVEKAQDDLAKSSEKAAATGDKTASSWKNIAGGVFAGGAALGAAKTAFNALKNVMSESMQEAATYQNNQAALNAAITSTKGAAGLTVAELNNMASELQNLTAIDDDVINTMQSMQLSFTNIKAPIFKEVSLAALDMATAMNKNVLPSTEQLQTASIQLGKAMQDPVSGATALQKIGIKLTDQQKEQIKTMIQSGDVMGAQKVILGELSTEFGGRAAAAANTYQGQISRLNNVMGDVKKQIGQMLIPTLSLLTGGIADSTGKVIMSDDTMHKWQIKIYQVATIMVGAIATVGNFAKGVYTLGRVIFDSAKVQINAFIEVGKAIMNIGQIAKNVFKGMGQAVTGDFSGAWQTLSQQVKSSFTGTLSAIKGFGASTGDLIVGMATSFDPLSDAIKKATDLSAFNEQIKKMKEAETTAKQFAGGMSAAVADAGESAKEKAKDIQSSWEKVRDTYKDGGEKIGEALAKLEEDHSSSVKGMNEKMADLRKGFQDTVASYKESVADMNKTEAERFIEQEQKIADLKKQIATEQASGSTSEDNNANQARIAELQAQLQKEEAALTQYAQRAKDLEKEITEARRRSSQSDFANFEEDMIKKRAQLDAEHIKKLQDISTEVAQLELAAAEETVIYEAKKKQYNEVAIQFQAFHDTYVKNLDDMKTNTDKSVSDMNKKLQEMLSILSQIESAKNKAGILNATPGLGGAATTPSGSSAGNGAGGITVNFGDVHVNSQADIDALMAALARQLQLSGQGSH